MEAPAIGAGRPRATARRRLSAALWRRPWLRAAALLLPPLGWMVVLYLASLALLFVYAFWSLDSFTGKVVHSWTLSNFREIVDNATYRRIAFRTIGIAALVTLTDALIAFPFAYYMARLASRRTRTLLFVLVLLPLALPGVVAGSIFTFSLTLGDYITPTLVGNTQFIGNVVYRNVLVLSHDLPFAAAYATIPLLVMGLYLTLAKRAGAFEAL